MKDFSLYTTRVNLFQTKLKDGLVGRGVPDDPDDRTYFRNAARVEHFGWEISVDGSVARDLSLRVAYTNVDATYEFYETDDDVFSGNAVPGLAPQRLDGIIIFDRDLGFIDLHGLWQDDVPVDDGGTTSSPSYFIADARIGLDRLVLARFNVAPFLKTSFNLPSFLLNLRQ